MKKLFLILCVTISLIIPQLAFADNKTLTAETASKEAATTALSPTEIKSTEADTPSDTPEKPIAEDASNDNETTLSEEEVNALIQKHYDMINKETQSADNSAYVNLIASRNRSLSQAQRNKIADTVKRAAAQSGIRSSLIMAVIWQESTFNPNTQTGPCYGLMQVHSAYSGMSVADMKDIEKNIFKGVAELKYDYSLYPNDVMALTAYNRGTGNVRRGNYTTRYANQVLAKEKKILSAISIGK